MATAEAPAASLDGQVKITQWIMDTRNLWPKATKTEHLTEHAAAALSLLSEEERASVLRYHFIRDAKMSLASHLLKHHVLSKCLSLPWPATYPLACDANKKPIFLTPQGAQPLFFNVTHQAGLVALAAVHGYHPQQKVDVGVDIVCPSERRARDHQLIAREGWPQFIDMHSDVFGRHETEHLRSADDRILLQDPRYAHLDPHDEEDREDITDAKLRLFYTLWCLREAYVKMTGEALLASWLHDLNFQSLRAPAPAATMLQSAAGGGGSTMEEETITKHDVLFRGAPVDDANICLRSLGPDYMTCTAIRTPGRKEDGLSWSIGPFEMITVDEIVESAAAAGAQAPPAPTS